MRIITSDEDCADCLCRVCARNSSNDSYNRKVGNDVCCGCDCSIGDMLIESLDDCRDFLPDEDDEVESPKYYKLYVFGKTRLETTTEYLSATMRPNTLVKATQLLPLIPLYKIEVKYYRE